MRRTVLAATVALLALLWLPGAAGAVDLPSHRSPVGRPPGADAVAALQPRTAKSLSPGIKLAGTAVVSGQVRNYAGAVLPDSYVYWDVPADSGWEWGETYTDAAGLYTFTNLPAASANGYVSVSAPSEPWWGLARFNASWDDPGTTTFDFRPGIVPMSVTRGGVWTDWRGVTVYLYGSDARSSLIGGSDIPGTGQVVTGSAYAAPGAYEDGAVYFWMDQGVEFTTSATVNAGAVSGQSVSVSQVDAQRIFVATPYWASGKPGTTVKVRHDNYPAGWTLDYSGYADSPSGKPYKTYGSITTSGADPFTRSFTIPTTAPAGYWYDIEAEHNDAPLELVTPFQVCTLKSSQAAIREGASVKLSGVIPTEGHWGSQAGKSKWVTVYKRTRSASVAPTTWDATRKGWTKVKSLKANGLGRYSGYFKPGRTTWYVVRYPGDNWYWGAYTSVLKVRVY